jgi:hypothetical protein
VRPLRLVADSAELDRNALISEIAHTAHQTWMRQAARDRDVPIEQLGNLPTEHDRERAADIVATLEHLGLYPRAPRSSRFGFFRHPLVVGAGIAAISAVFASLLIPSFTRVSADRPKELELKRGIVGTIATSSRGAHAGGRSRSIGCQCSWRWSPGHEADCVSEAERRVACRCGSDQRGASYLLSN